MKFAAAATLAFAASASAFAPAPAANVSTLFSAVALFAANIVLYSLCFERYGVLTYVDSPVCTVNGIVQHAAKHSASDVLQG